ncbi:MAG TPA: rhodanese-like domain-containing protein [Bryobacteraceae bacterium]|jgi:membrane protein DedA with SNARE-associated domain/rhodanese-related sulfurtransferase
MESLIAGLAEYGYGLLFAAVFLETVGMPVPAALALLIAGGASARGSLQASYAFPGALAVTLAGDSLMFLMGRHMGWWLLGLLCRLSLNPDSCILRAADSFYKRGRILLVFAKFVPGINAIAPPMAGSMNMRLGQFFRFDLAGAFLYVSAYFWVGYFFSDALSSITRGYHVFGRVAAWVLFAAAMVYAGALARMWVKARGLSVVPLVDPEEAARGVTSESAVIYDVRSHGYYDPKATRIKGSRRLDPNALHQWERQMPDHGKVYLYCTCIREATSSRVARELIGKGVPVAVIKGGLKKWKEAGLPLEAVPAEEMSALPVFER